MYKSQNLKGTIFFHIFIHLPPTLPLGHWDANHQVFLLALSCQQHGIRCQQNRKLCGAHGANPLKIQTIRHSNHMGGWTTWRLSWIIGWKHQMKATALEKSGERWWRASSRVICDSSFFNRGKGQKKLARKTRSTEQWWARCCVH